MAKKKNDNDKNDKVEEIVLDDIIDTDESIDDVVEEVIEEPVVEEHIVDNGKKKVPYMNDKGLIKIRATRPAYNMIVGQIWERPGHIADNLVREGVAEYIEFIEV